ncbi:MAG: T9SS type A sorting domain-containing protein [Flavisolibacter sp.]
MKIKQALMLTAGLAMIGTVAFFLEKTSERKFEVAGEEEHEAKERREKEDAARFNVERMKYEYEMLKDPVTGKIPKGIFEKEVAFALSMPVKNADVPAGANRRVVVQNTYLPVGPNNIGGRTRAVAYDKRYNGSTNRVIISGCVSGGIMRSADGGNTWTLVTPQNDIHSFTTLAQDLRPGFEDTWYAAGGEPYGNTAGGYYAAPYRGFGIWKSVNNGVSWTKLAPTVTDQGGGTIPPGTHEFFDNPFDYTYNMAVNPTNGDLFVAAFGVILRSNNGGTSFQAVLGSFAASTSLSTATGQTEVAISSSGRIMAAMNGGHNNTALRGVWTSATGGAGSFSRVAGGQTIGVDSIPGWRANAPTGTGKRILITFAPSNANVGYVFYENGQSSEPPDLKPEADLFRFDISGSSITWSNRSANMPDFAGGNASGSDPLAVQGGYDMMVKVKPDNPNTVFIGGTNLYRSTDGFSTSTNTAWINGYNTNFTYQVYPNGHPDIHELVFNPTNSNEGICGNDGGIQISSNLTAAAPSWRMVSNYQTIQYYYVAMDPDAGRNNFVGGAQDNGVLFRDKLRVLGIPASDSNNHVQMISADGSAVGISRVSPSNPVQFVYGGYQYGKILRFRLPNVFNPDDIRPGNLTTAYEGAEDDYGEFVTNFHLDPDNTEDLYYINFNRLFRTTAASSVTAGGWTELMGVSAAVNPSNGRGVSIRAVAFTRGPYNTAHSIYLGTTNGRVFRLDDPRNAAPGKAPADITPTGLNGNVQDIAVNPNNDNEVMVTVSNYNTTSIWWTNNAKSSFPSWKNAEGNLTLPSIRSCRIVVKKDAANNPVTEYYVGTSVGLYSTENLEGILTLNGSPLWRREGDAVLNLAVIQSLAYRPADNVMVIGTHGNGMYYTFLGTANFNPVQTAVEPVTNDKNFIHNVYPTVSPNTVSFETGNMVGVRKIVVHLYDASGRLVFSETKGYTNGSLTLAPFARGTYFLSIYSEDRKYRHLQKLVKQ